MTAPKLIIGIGNILLKDEGVGVRVVEAMLRMTLPPDVEAIDGGTSGADLIDVLAGRDKLVVVDAVDMKGSPGSLYRFGMEDLLEVGVIPLSLHNFGLGETLHMAKVMNCLPREIVILGVVPKEISPGTELTPEIQAAMPAIIEHVLKEVTATAERD